MDRTDAARSLNVDPDADAQDIRRAYYAAVRQHPPSRDAAQFQRLKDAYSVLTGKTRARPSSKTVIQPQGKPTPAAAPPDAEIYTAPAPAYAPPAPAAAPTYPNLAVPPPTPPPVPTASYPQTPTPSYAARASQSYPTNPGAYPVTLRKMEWWWWLIGLFTPYGIGGIIGYFAVRNYDPRGAKALLAVCLGLPVLSFCVSLVILVNS